MAAQDSSGAVLLFSHIILMMMVRAAQDSSGAVRETRIYLQEASPLKRQCYQTPRLLLLIVSLGVDRSSTGKSTPVAD
jgi:hypothetical protein